MDEKTILYLAQTESMECFQLLLNAYKKNSILFFNVVEAGRSAMEPWKSIQNPTMLSGNEIWLFSPQQLLITDDNYAFDYNDIDYLLKKKNNPFTKQPWTPAFQEKLKNARSDWRYGVRIYPLSMAYEGFADPGTWCMSRIPMINMDPKRWYYHSPVPWSDLPTNDFIVVSSDYIKTTWHYEYIYEIYLKKPQSRKYSDIWILPSSVASIKLIFDPFKNIVPISPHRKNNFIPKEHIIAAIQNYHKKQNGRTSNISPAIIQQMMSLPLRPSKPYQIFRGMYNAKTIFKLPVRLGETRSITFERPSSWTTNRCMAEVYASYISSYGIIISMLVDPKDVIVDSRYIDNEWIKNNLNRVVFVPVQDELLLRAGTYQVRIENIIYSSHPHGYNKKQSMNNRVDLVYGWKY